MCEKCIEKAAKSAAQQAERAEKVRQTMAAAAGSKPAGAAAKKGGAAAGAAQKGPFKDKFVLSLQLHGVGGTPLGGERVVVVDPDTGKEVGEAQTTDAEGRIWVEVPENKPYDLRLVPDEESDPSVPEQPDDHDLNAQLFCRFVDVLGHPIVGETVTIRGADGEPFEVETDVEGDIEPGMDPGRYELEIRGERFQAHTLLVRDLVHDGGEHYTFVVGDQPYDPSLFEHTVRRGEAHEEAIEHESESESA